MVDDDYIIIFLFSKATLEHFGSIGKGLTIAKIRSANRISSSIAFFGVCR
ncbi:MAG: hypothetical protein HC908_03585 [Calothrix sp. SM1_7_51]|nr:hypothetical protein [Calothrix sp. SM1_7_51]